jgi:hypothetical protein
MAAFCCGGSEGLAWFHDPSAPDAKLGAVIGLVADEALRCLGDEPFRGAVIRFAAGQEDGERRPRASAGTFVLRLPLSPSPAGERCAVVRVKDHLLALARIGTHERHAAVAEPHMGDLHGRLWRHLRPSRRDRK